MICVYKNYSSDSSVFAYRYAEDNYKTDVGYKPFILKGYTIVDEEYKEWQESHNKLNV